MLPLSLTPASRFSSDSKRSPSGAATAMTTPSTIDCPIVRKSCLYSATKATKTVAAVPNTNPSHVFPGDVRGRGGGAGGGDPSNNPQPTPPAATATAVNIHQPPAYAAPSTTGSSTAATRRRETQLLTRLPAYPAAEAAAAGG